MINHPSIQLTKALVERASVTPHDGGCQDLLAERLARLGFHIEAMPFGQTRNLWATHGTGEPVLVFAGHTDVVPEGPLEAWKFPPYSAQIHEGKLYGRGAADMKSGLAAMLVACERFLTKHPDHRGTLAWLITSDEEGPFVDGTVRVLEALKQRQQPITWCLVGEPSSEQHIGDVIKVGRRGSLNATLTIHGKQGHVAYAHLADNAIHKAMLALHALASHVWDEGGHGFPPTSLQITTAEAGHAINVIPGQLTLRFNIRYSTLHTLEQLQHATEAILARHLPSDAYTLHWQSSGAPFLTRQGDLLNAVEQSIATVTGRTTQRSTAGGTSDGRFFAPLGVEVVELGVVNQTIHQINECVALEEVVILTDIYEAILQQLLS